MLAPLVTRRALPALLAALSFAVAAAAPLRVATLNIELGLGAPGTPGHDAAEAVLARLGADVVGLQEIQSGDLSGEPSALESLASALGYPVIHLAGTSNVLDSSSRVAFLSRYPITSSTNIVPPAGALDMARQIAAIVVDVPDLPDDPTILTLHLKCCFDFDDSFRRAVELHRAAAWLQTSGFTSADNVIVLGDFNLIGFDQTYDELPPGLPAGYVLGNDVAFPVNYTVAPAPYFSALSMTALDARQLDGDRATVGSNTLDYILATPALTSRPHASEIYNSALDTSNAQGLPKAGLPLPAGTSANASDHYAIFADFELAPLPVLALLLSTPSIAESDPSGAAILTVTLPFAPEPGEPVEVALNSSDPGEAIPAEATIIFEAGVVSREVEVVPQLDALLDGSQLVTLTASAPGFGPASIGLTITDSSPTTFVFTPDEPTHLEEFATFDGSADPARWPASGGTWRGLDDGTRAAPGNYAYGSALDPSFGVLLGGVPVSTTATCVNLTGAPITALEIAYHAEQWRSSPGGNPDQIVAELLIDGIPVALPALTFLADTTLPAGPIPGGTATPLAAIVSHLAIPDRSAFQLRFTATPGGPGGALPSDVFLNEIHYDNTGADLDEFLEIVVGPGYTDPVSRLAVVLYNGSGGTTYSTQTLDTFTLDATTASGHRIYSKLIPGIQNGSPDGLAIVQGQTVLHFLSYEGVFVATNGPASGMTSVDLGVEQDNPVPAPGSGSLGLTGTGREAPDYVWTRFPGPFTRGAPNPGQSFTAPPGSQGISIDNISITHLLDSDLDGIPDILDPDSRLVASITLDPDLPGGVLLSFPTLAGRLYTIEHSPDLLTWTARSAHFGDDSTLTIPVSGDPLEPSNFFRVRVAWP